MNGVDEGFLNHLNEWRFKLANNIYQNNKQREINFNGVMLKLVFSPSLTSKRSLQIIKESIQQILDRLIILRIAEDQMVIKANQLFEMERVCNKNDSKYVLYNVLNNFFSDFYEKYRISIFKPGHICESLYVDNQVLGEIISQSYEHCFLNFNFDILGSSYENYLGQVLSLKANEIRFQQSNQKQKADGIYYTPPFIIKFILENTVGIKLRKDLAKIENLLLNNKKNEILTHLEEFKKVKILDPACGSGIFLIEAYKLIDAHYSALGNLLSDIFPKFFEKKNLFTTLFGIDLDPNASRITAINIFLQSMISGENPSQDPQNNIFTGNFITSETPSKLDGHLFSYIIGNPPYIAWNLIADRNLLETGRYFDLEYDCRPNHKDSQPNIYLFFLVKSINLIKNGRIGFILPQEWRFENNTRKFRNYLLEKCDSIQIIRFNPQFKVFRNYGLGQMDTIGTNSLILFLDISENKLSNKTLVEYYIEELDDSRIISYLTDLEKLEENSSKIIRKFDDLIDIPWIFANPQDEKIKNEILSLTNIVHLENSDYFLVKGGFQPPVSTISSYEIDEEIFQTLSTREKNKVFPAIFNASDMQRYFLNWQGKYWIILNDISNETILKQDYPTLYRILSKNLNPKLPNWWKFPNIRNLNIIKQSQIKLLSPRTASQNSFSIDEIMSVFKGTNTFIVSKKLDPYYLIGILNSKLASYWYSRFGFEYHGEKAKKHEPQKVRQFSIPIIIPSSTDIENKLINFVKKLITLKKIQGTGLKNDEVQKIDDKIDELIFELYELNPDEITLIKKDFK